MHEERLQIVVSKRQRALLDRESARRGVSMSGLVRDAIDMRYAEPSREDRMAAAAQLRAARGQGVDLSADELDRLVERGAEERLDKATRGAESGG